MTNKLQGAWKLVSCIGRSAQGQEFLPYGEAPLGWLFYTGDKVSVCLMNSKRSNFSSSDLSQVTAEEKVTAFDEFDAYCGTYSIDSEKELVIHNIECGRVPNWIGTEHTRYFSVSANLLTLTTAPFEMAGQSWQVEVKWSR